MWQKKTGPGEVIFSNPSRLNTMAEFSEQGIYKLRLTATDDGRTTSDEITVYFVKDFVDRTVAAGKQEDVVIEAEDYRYLVGAAQVTSLSDEQNKAVTAQEGGNACTVYQISTKEESAYYVWIYYAKEKDCEGGLTVTFNSAQIEKIVSDEAQDGANGYVWQKIAFKGVPEGSYPLIIKASGPGLAWDKIYITCDAGKKPL